MPESAIAIRPVAYEIRLRNTRTRIPFRYGPTVLVACPIAHLFVTVEGPGGARVEGLAGDALAPGWYDKRPNRTYRNDIDELSETMREAGRTLMALSETGPRSVFELWRDLVPSQLEWARKNNCTDMTGNFGASMFERALIDATGKLTGKTFHALVNENMLGIDPGAVKPYLKGWQAREALAPEPLKKVFLRHTVGGLDPLTAADVPAAEIVKDGLPHTLEDYLQAQRLRYFKLKLRCDEAFDIDRLRTIAALLDKYVPANEPYHVTLDGNEVYYEPEKLTQLLAKLSSGGVSKRFYDSILFVEQPFPRQKALEDSLRDEISKISKYKSLIVDESTENLESVPRALELGYAGFAIKSCKGPIKALLEKGAMVRHPKRPANPIVSGEDMTNQPVVPLFEDLTVMATLGVEHVERNGHHFFRGMSVHSDAERAAVLAQQPNLYARKGPDLVALRTETGALDVSGLVVRPGLGVLANEVDRSAILPLDEWKYESLGLK